MKLWNVLSVAAIGTLFVVGCSSTTTTVTDGGPTGDTGTATDTGAKVDTGPATDTGPVATDSGSCTEDGGSACATCQLCKCNAEVTACSTTAANPGCKALFDCMAACADAACQNTCVTNSKSAEGKALVGCVVDNCVSECSG